MDKVRNYENRSRASFLETPIGEEEDSHLGDFIPDDEAPSCRSCNFTMLKEQLINVLDTLTPREEKVLRIKIRFR